MTTPRIPIYIAHHQIGSLAAADLPLIVSQAQPALFTVAQEALHIDPTAPDATLAHWAGVLRDAGRLGRWRNELLPVAPLPAADCHTLKALPSPLAVAERSAARRLGILTHAVHLVGRAANGDVWLQQRAWDKATDPGLWDTLAGGLLSAGDSLISGVLRETDEEAGVLAHQLSPLVNHGCMLQRRAVPDGVIIEAVWTFSAVLDAAVPPKNRDGEVIAFECVRTTELAARVGAGLVTHEAQLALRAAACLV